MILRFLIEEDTTVAPIESVDACYARVATQGARFSNTVDRAAAGGFVADRIGYAFVAGYRAALSKLDPSLSRASLCASESGGAHPRAIHTRLEPRGDAFVLNGEKTFSTLASDADVLLVVASRGERDGRNQLQIARIPSKREGVTIRDREPIAFAPEIPHARVRFHEVRVDPSEILDGDGYDRFLKPFRTIEDVHVIAASLGHVVRVARAYDEPREIVERALAAIAALRTIGEEDPLAPAAHIALAGVLALAAELAGRMNLANAEDAVRTRWQRDLPLLGVAGAARNARLEAAHAFSQRRADTLTP
ncbi:MAG TPA: acyl-CoA dehydrogenase family protein [Polyangiaceae bacterium]|jgi:alkylation response protein AidB-like acyl-CoA dehydrogenase